MSKDLHKKPFDESTIAKLEIFKDYAQASASNIRHVWWSRNLYFWFFCGNRLWRQYGIPGSPIRLLEKIKEQVENIGQKNVRVKVYFNEFDKEKYELLSACCTDS